MTSIHEQNVESKVTTSTTTRQFVQNRTEPNVLHEYASYNALFTLSALSQNDLLDTKALLDSTPHDIIIKSGGIGAEANQRGYGPLDARQGRGGETLSADNKKLVSSNERLAKTLGKARAEFMKNKDLYFNSVRLSSVNGHNSDRPLTNVSNITMEINEPWGISLIDRIRAAAANNDYLDHLDAPYLLTIEFTGWNELGEVVQPKVPTKRVIPVKLTDMRIAVTAGGSVYNVTAIPWSEFAYVNRYAYPRTSGTLTTVKKTLSELVVELEDLLNQQGEDEKEKKLVAKPDKYEITIDKFFEPDKTEIVLDTIKKSDLPPSQGLGQENITERLDYLKFSPKDNVIKILSDIMKGHPKQRQNDFAKWREKVTKELKIEGTFNVKQRKNVDQDVYDKAREYGWYYQKFQIKSTVINTTDFDPVRSMNVKLIKLHVTPILVHAYSLAIPGVSTGDNFKNFVHKTYNYIFTGENVDILDLNIDYKVAYFQSRLKDTDETLDRNVIVPMTFPKPAGTDAQDNFKDGSFNFRSFPSLAKSSDNLANEKTSELDQFLDALTHPEADMVNIDLEILGDPAWLGQSQYIPTNPEKIAPGVSYDKEQEYWRSGIEAVWNDKLKCYNTELAEPILMLNFRMPTDLNDKTGVYELQSEQSANFSGLYRVVQVEHNFENGKYTNILRCTRFNNQGVFISSPMSEYRYVNKKDGTTHIVHQSQLPDNFLAMGGSIFSVNEKVNSLFAKLKSTKLYKSVARASQRIGNIFNV
jgi:hypothetical protein